MDCWIQTLLFQFFLTFRSPRFQSFLPLSAITFFWHGWPWYFLSSYSLVHCYFLWKSRYEWLSLPFYEHWEFPCPLEKLFPKPLSNSAANKDSVFCANFALLYKRRGKHRSVGNFVHLQLVKSEVFFFIIWWKPEHQKGRYQCLLWKER